MAKYELIDERTGAKFELEGDSPPTDSELESLFRSTSPQPQYNESPTGFSFGGGTTRGAGATGTFSEPSILGDWLDRIGTAPRRIAAQRARRPDLWKETVEVLKDLPKRAIKGETWKRIFMGTNIFDRALMRPSEALKAIGAVGQSVEGFLSSPPDVFEAVLDGRFKDAMKAPLLGALGISKAEWGDAYTRLGAPEGLASAAGLLTSFYAPEKIFVKAVGNMSRAIARKAVLSGYSKGKYALIGKMMHGVSESEATRLMSTGFDDVTSKTLKGDFAIVQGMANDLVDDTEKIHRMAAKTFQKALDETPEQIVKVDSAFDMARTLRRGLADERNFAVRDTLSNLQIGEKTITKSPTTGKIVESVKSVITDKPQAGTTDILRGASKTTPLGTVGKETVERIGGKTEGIIKEVSKKTTKTVTQAAKEVTVPRTINDLMMDAAEGKPTTAEDWYGVIQALQGEANAGNVRAVKLLNELRPRLSTEFPKLGDAFREWDLWTTIRDNRNILIGPLDKNKVPTKAENLATLLSDKGKNMPGGPHRTALKNLQKAVEDFNTGPMGNPIRPTPNYIDKAEGIAATARLASEKPRMMAVSLAGGLGVIAHGLGVPKQAIASLGAAVYALSSPKGYAKIGRALFHNPESLFKKTPKVMALQRLQGVTSLKEGVELAGDAWSSGIRSAAVGGLGRSLTGRNQLQPAQEE